MKTRDTAALAATRWSLRRVEVRATLHVVSFCVLMFVVLPAVLSRLLGETRWISPDRSSRSTLGLQLAAVLGLSAVQEFVRLGRGTPYPYDPPARMVVSGPYAYVANPMQLCKVLCLLFWGLFLGSSWVVLTGLGYLCFTAIWTAPREDRKLACRFGDPFLSYRRSVRRWCPRWRPHRVTPARLWLAESCGPCRGLGDWIRQSEPVALRILPAEDHPSRALTRMRYESDGIEESGLAALARALEHLHFGWAFLGWTLRLPGVLQLGQVVADAVGAGPRARLDGTCPASLSRLPASLTARF